MRLDAASRGRGVIARFFDHLPVSAETPVVTLGEGDTPLLLSERLSHEARVEVWLKLEGLNPTGSFKDRGMTVAVSKAMEDRTRAIACASTGNTSASAAAYAARAGIPCAVILPRGKVATGKLAQALVHGAKVFEIDGSFDAALTLARRLSDAYPVTLVNSTNPLRIEGQKTASFEVVEALGAAPDIHVMPVGNAGNITAYWRGYREAKNLGWTDRLPRMFGWQAEGANPIVRGEVVERPETIASAIRIGNPASWQDAISAAVESGGRIGSIDDAEIAGAYSALASEGIFVELASAAGVAGLWRMRRDGDLEGATKVVCVLTGHGLKDPEWAASSVAPPTPLAQDAAAIAAALELDA